MKSPALLVVEQRQRRGDVSVLSRPGHVQHHVHVLRTGLLGLELFDEAHGIHQLHRSLHVIQQRHDHVGVVDGDDRLGPDRLQTGKGGIPGEYAYAVDLLSELPALPSSPSSDSPEAPTASAGRTSSRRPSNQRRRIGLPTAVLSRRTRER